jgi:hypothetical protein
MEDGWTEGVRTAWWRTPFSWVACSLLRRGGSTHSFAERISSPPSLRSCSGFLKELTILERMLAFSTRGRQLDPPGLLERVLASLLDLPVSD